MKTEEILNHLNKIYDTNKYDFSTIKNANLEETVYATCKEHGIFHKRLHRLLSGSGCPICSGKSRKTTEQFIIDAKKVHGGKYNYSKSVYKNAKTKLTITCPKHGDFEITPTNHTSGKIGCPKCSLEELSKRFRSNTDNFVKKAIVKHGNKYDYSSVNYVNNYTKIGVICHKHGIFYITPFNHLSGKGCPICKSSKIENEIRDLLQKENIDFEQQKTFDWLKDNGLMFLDFYLPQHNIAIECQGRQHFEGVTFGSTKLTEEECLKDVANRDKLKFNLCKEHGIDILYFSNLGIEYPYQVFEDKSLLLEEINKHAKETK